MFTCNTHGFTKNIPECFPARECVLIIMRRRDSVKCKILTAKLNTVTSTNEEFCPKTEGQRIKTSVVSQEQFV